MKKTSIKLLVIALILTLVAYYFYNNFLYKDARNIDEEKPSFFFSASNLGKEYVTDAIKADLKYLNKTIEIEGKITEDTDSTLVLDNKIFCKMNQKINISFMNKPITIKGRCIGYDDLSDVVKFDQCSKQ